MINKYGVNEINPMKPGYHDIEPEYMNWEELKTHDKITAERIRFVTSPNYPFMDLTYLHVRINNVRYEILNSPFYQVPRKDFKKHIYNILKNEKVFINGFFDTISKLY